MIMAQLATAFAAEADYRQVDGAVVLVDQDMRATSVAAHEVGSRLRSADPIGVPRAVASEPAAMVVAWDGLRHAFCPRAALDQLCDRIGAGGRLIYAQNLTDHYLGLTPKWLLDYFVASQYADCRVYLLWPPAEAPAVATFIYRWIIDHAQPVYNRMWDNITGATAVLVVAEKGVDTRPGLPSQDNYRPVSEWDQYSQVLRQMLTSKRPWHLTGPAPTVVPAGCQGIPEDAIAIRGKFAVADSRLSQDQSASRGSGGKREKGSAPLANHPQSLQSQRDGVTNRVGGVAAMASAVHRRVDPELVPAAGRLHAKDEQPTKIGGHVATLASPVQRLDLILGVGGAVIIVLLSLWMATSLLNSVDSTNSIAQAAIPPAPPPQPSRAKPVAQAAPQAAAAPSSVAPKAAAAATVPVTPLTAVPKITTPGLSLVSIVGLNVQPEDEVPPVAGQRVLRVTAASTSLDGRHYLAVQAGGLKTNQTYRLTAWVKTAPGMNVALQGRDQPDSDHPPHNGIGLFAPTKNQVLANEMHVDGSGVLDGPGGWKKIWIDLPTSDGKLAVVLFLLDGTNYAFKGDSTHQITFGGVEVTQKGAPSADVQAAASTPVSETPLARAPKMTTPGYSLLAAPGLNIQATGEKPVVEGQQVERITAASNSKDGEDRHYLAMQVVGLKPGQTYRLIAWVKAVPAMDVALQGRDQPDSDHPPHNGIGLFAPTNNQVLANEMNVEGSGVLDGPGGWKKVWIDLPTSDGKFVLVLFLLDGTNYTFKGDNTHQITFGGIEAVPKP